MGSLRFEIQIAGRRTVIESDWDEVRDMYMKEPIPTVDVIEEIQHSIQRLLNGAAMPGDKPLRVTIAREEI